MIQRYVGARPPNRLQTQLIVFGGGYAGRVSPQRDRTLDEAATGILYDDEGNSGGWVLPLHVWQEEDTAVIPGGRTSAAAASRGAALDPSDEGFTGYCGARNLFNNVCVDYWIAHVPADATHRANSAETWHMADNYDDYDVLGEW